jgi:DNA repair protein RecO (recombination protein O)
MATNERSEQTAFLLHSIPYRETSLIVDLFTREHGRIAAVAKGARRRQSVLRPVLMSFQPIRVILTGRNELRNLIGAEWSGGMVAPDGDALICSFYMNELLIKLLAREDPHPLLFDAYCQALSAFAAAASLDATLRVFEWHLLRETGYAPDLRQDADGKMIAADHCYRWLPNAGFIVSEPDEAAAVSGATIKDISTGQFQTALARQQAKILTRTILSHHLNGAPIHSRQILIDLQKL